MQMFVAENERSITAQERKFICRHSGDRNNHIQGNFPVRI
jgi:hypothetical protein